VKALPQTPPEDAQDELAALRKEVERLRKRIKELESERQPK
jgi:ubiquinone biosynthesis protein UbiJ